MLRWLFLDMNSYFASAEQHDRPTLRGRPVGVKPSDTDHTCMIAASAEAKAHGVRTGTLVREAQQLCPDINILLARPKRYVELHQQLLAATDKHAPIHKVYSIDEWAIRLLREQQQPQSPDGALALAHRIKAQIRQDLSPALTCSIGLAPTRLLAKIACEMKKPDGLTVLMPDDLPDALSHLSLRDLPGIGSGMVKRLQQHNIHDIPTLWELSARDARRIWGSVQGEHWWMGFHGHDVPEIPTHRHSLGHSHVLPPERRNDRDTLAILVRLLSKACVRLRDQACWCTGLHVSIRYENGRRWGQAATFPATADTPTLLKTMRELYAQHPYHTSRVDPEALPFFPGMLDEQSLDTRAQPKTVGVDLLGLTEEHNTTLPLFSQMEKPLEISRVMDRINRRYGSHTLYFGAMHSVHDYAMDDKIAFGRIPEQTIDM